MDVINMEVKIKQGNEMLDATIEMVDGVMVVSPKVLKFKPKDGDVVSVDDGSHIFICKYYIGDGDLCAYIGWDFEHNFPFEEGDWSASRYATEEEKKRFFDKLKEEGWEWKPDTKELIKLKWKPKIGETYYRPDFFHCEFICYSAITDYDNIVYIKDYINKGWVFRTKEECERFCSKLNKAIEGVKP